MSDSCSTEIKTLGILKTGTTYARRRKRALLGGRGQGARSRFGFTYPRDHGGALRETSEGGFWPIGRMVELSTLIERGKGGGGGGC